MVALMELDAALPLPLFLAALHGKLPPAKNNELGFVNPGSFFVILGIAMERKRDRVLQLNSISGLNRETIRVKPR